MDKFQPDSSLDESQRHAKFLEKIGSTIFTALFIALFWYYARGVENGDVCYANSTSDVVVLATAEGAF